MCKPHAPDTSRQEAEAARQSQAEQTRYQDQLAAQQAEWDRQRADSERRYQEQLKLQQDEITRQHDQQAQSAADAEKLRKEQIAQQEGVNARGRSYADYRDAALDAGKSSIEGAYGGFNDDYFNKFAGDFVKNNRGDTDRSWERGKRSMKYKLDDNRNLNSSAAADAFGEMDTDHDSAIAKIAAAGSQKANAYKMQVNSQKSNALNALYGLGNQTVPDFQNDEDASAAKSRIGQAIMGMTSNIAVPGY